MPRKLKVWGGGGVRGSQRVRHLVAATTKKRAVELLKERVHPCHSRYDFDLMWCETGNDRELAIANREGVWVYPDQWSNGKLLELTVTE